MIAGQLKLPWDDQGGDRRGDEQREGQGEGEAPALGRARSAAQGVFKGADIIEALVRARREPSGEDLEEGSRDLGAARLGERLSGGRVSELSDGLAHEGPHAKEQLIGGDAKRVLIGGWRGLVA